MSDPATVIDFWLNEVGPEGWYAGGKALDAKITKRFKEIWQAASDDKLEHWLDGATGCLGYLIVTDQFPRNMFRGSGKAFSTDPRARAAAARAIAEGWDMATPEPERQFLYLPFEHSEDPMDQDRAVDLTATRMTGAAGAESALHARAHQEVIRRFGRFPFRNDALGRKNTAEEVQYLEGGAYGSTVKALRK